LNIVLLEGAEDHPSTKLRTDSIKDRFKEKGINVNYVFEDNANWDK
jgi:inositol transport system substrate-binding protein